MALCRAGTVAGLLETPSLSSESDDKSSLLDSHRLAGRVAGLSETPSSSSDEMGGDEEMGGSSSSDEDSSLLDSTCLADIIADLMASTPPSESDESSLLDSLSARS